MHEYADQALLLVFSVSFTYTRRVSDRFSHSDYMLSMRDVGIWLCAISRTSANSSSNAIHILIGHARECLCLSIECTKHIPQLHSVLVVQDRGGLTNK